MIIALHGQKNNGKDTAGEILIELGNSEGIRFKRVAFADLMKKLAANSLGIYDGEIDFINFVKDEVILLQGNNKPSIGHIQPLSIREYLINFSQTMKSQFGDDFWAHLAFSNIAPWPDIVVTDLRFEAEAEYLRDLGAYVVHIYREEDQEDGDLPGEKKLPEAYIDYHLPNTGTLEELKSNTKELLKNILYDEQYESESTEPEAYERKERWDEE